MSGDKKELPFKVADFIGPLHFEWHSQNPVGNVGILVLWRDCEKLGPQHKLFNMVTCSEKSVPISLCAHEISWHREFSQ